MKATASFEVRRDPCRCGDRASAGSRATRRRAPRAPLRPPPAARSDVPLLPISPAVRSHRPTRSPSAAWRAMVPPRPISRSSGCGPNTSRSTESRSVRASRMSRTAHEAERPRRPARPRRDSGAAGSGWRDTRRSRCGWRRRTRTGAAESCGAGRCTAGRRRCVRTARPSRTPARCPRCPGRASTARTSAGRFAARSSCRAGGPATGSPSAPLTSSRSSSTQRTAVRRRGGVARCTTRATPELLPHPGRNRFGQREEPRLRPEVAGERLEERRRLSGRNDDMACRITPPGRDVSVAWCSREPVRMIGERSKIRAPRPAAAAARPSVARYGSSVGAVAPAHRRHHRRGDAASLPPCRPAARASRPASRRAFCSRLSAAACSASARRAVTPAVRSRQLRSRRRTSAAKSSAARRQAWHAWRAVRPTERAAQRDEAGPGVVGDPP